MELNRAQRDYLMADLTARKEVYEKYNRKKKIDNAALYLGVPLIAGLGAGAAHGNLLCLNGETCPKGKVKVYGSFASASQKFKAAAKGTKWWGAMFLGGLVGAGIAKTLMNKVKPLKEFKEENPGVTRFAALLGAIGLAALANPITDKSAKLIGKIPIGKSAKTIGERVSGKLAGIAAKLNDPKGYKGIGQAFNKHVFNPLGNFLTKNKVGRGLYAYAPLLLIGAAIGKHFVDSDKIKRDVNNKRNAILAGKYVGTSA